jgi:hypothetical protein
VVTEQETGLCEVEVKLGGVEAEAAGRLAVGVGGHLVLGLGHDALGLAASGIPERGQGTQLAPGEDLRPAQWCVGVFAGLAGQVERFGVAALGVGGHGLGA